MVGGLVLELTLILVSSMCIIVMGVTRVISLFSSRHTKIEGLTCVGQCRMVSGLESEAVKNSLMRWDWIIFIAGAICLTFHFIHVVGFSIYNFGQRMQWFNFDYISLFSSNYEMDEYRFKQRIEKIIWLS